MEDRILHALDLAAVAEWDEARRALQGVDAPIVSRLIVLIDELQGRHEQRKSARAMLRHELGNALTIAHANVEGMLDGVVPASPQRLANVRDALTGAAELLNELQRPPLPEEAVSPRAEALAIADLLSAKVRDLQPVAAAKNVDLGCDELAFTDLNGTNVRAVRDAVERAVVTGLLSAVRYTPPGGSVRIVGCKPDGEVLLTLRKSAVAKILDAIGSGARLIDRTDEVTTLGVTLPRGKESER